MGWQKFVQYIRMLYLECFILVGTVFFIIILTRGGVLELGCQSNFFDFENVILVVVVAQQNSAESPFVVECNAKIAEAAENGLFVAFVSNFVGYFVEWVWLPLRPFFLQKWISWLHPDCNGNNIITNTYYSNHVILNGSYRAIINEVSIVICLGYPKGLLCSFHRALANYVKRNCDLKNLK